MTKGVASVLSVATYHIFMNRQATAVESTPWRDHGNVYYLSVLPIPLSVNCHELPRGGAIGLSETFRKRPTYTPLYIGNMLGQNIPQLTQIHRILPSGRLKLVENWAATCEIRVYQDIVDCA